MSVPIDKSNISEFLEYFLERYRSNACKDLPANAGSDSPDQIEWRNGDWKALNNADYAQPNTMSKNSRNPCAG